MLLWDGYYDGNTITIFISELFIKDWLYFKLCFPMLQYLAILHKTGQTIYSKCFESFCKQLKEDKKELKTFVEALQEIPVLIESKKTRKQLFLKNKVLLYRESMDQEFVFLAIFPESMQLNSTCEDLKRLFDNFYNLFSSQYYKELNWDDMSIKQFSAIQSNLESMILRPWCMRAQITDSWTPKNNCILDIKPTDSKKPYWELVKDKYFPIVMEY